MSPQKTITAGAWRDVGLLTALWGASFVSMRIAADEIGPLTVVAHRVFWAALALWVLAGLRRWTIPRGWRIWLAFLAMGAMNNVIPFALIAWGQLHIETGLASILNASTAIFAVAVAALVFADERLSTRRVMGVGLGFAGVVIATGTEVLQTFDIRSVGQLAILGASLSYACAAAWARYALGGFQPEIAALCMLSGSAIIALPLAWLVEGPFDLTLAPSTLAALGYVSVLATAAAYLLYYRIVAAAGAGNAMVITLTIPPIAILLGALLRQEVLAPQVFAGFAVLALGLITLNGGFAGLIRLPSRRRSR